MKRLFKQIILVFILVISQFYGYSFSQEDEESDGENELSGAKISVPWNDFKLLLDKMKHDTVHNKTEEILPAQWVVSDAQFTGKPQNEKECIFNAKLIVNVLDPEAWIEIPLGRGLQIFPDFTFSPKSGSIGMREDGTAFIFLHGKGAYAISYRFLVPVTYNSGKFTVNFPLPGQAASRISMDPGADNFSVQANDRPLSITHKDKYRSTYDGGLGNCTDAIISWQQMASSTGNKDAMVSSNLNTVYAIASDVVKISSQINFTIVHNSIRQFSFSVPANVDIIDVSGNPVATWETRDSAQIKIVTTYLKYDIKDNVNFLLHAEMGYPDSATIINLPAITMNNVTRQEGLIGTGVLSSIEVNPYDHSNNILMRDKRDIPEWFSDQGDIIHVYQYLSDNYRIALELTRHKNIQVLNALITSASIQSMIREDGKMVSTMNLNVRNRGEQFLRLQWKNDSQLWSVYCNNKPAHPSFDSLSNELLIPLERTNDRTLESSIVITFLSLQKSFKNFGAQEIDYPKFNMPVQNLRGSLFLPQVTKVILKKGAMSSVDVIQKPWFTSFLRKKEYAETMTELAGIREVSDDNLELSNNSLGELKTRVSRGVFESMDMIADSILKAGKAQQDFEAGILSIPVQINFEGTMVPCSVPILKRGDSLKISFYHYHLSSLQETIINLIVQILMICAGVMLTIFFYKATSIKVMLYGIMLPVTGSFLLQRTLDRPLNIDILIVIPSVFMGYKGITMVIEFIKKRNKLKAGDDTIEIPGVDNNLHINKPEAVSDLEE